MKLMYKEQILGCIKHVYKEAYWIHHAKEGAPKRGLKRLSTTCKDPPQVAGYKKGVTCQRL